jgi:hypothetical protein
VVSSLAGTPTGSVIFLDGSNPLGTSALSGGVASLITSNLALGSHSITAQYGGNAGFTAAASPAVSETVQDFSLSITAPAQIIPHGGTATYSLTVSPIGGATMPSAISFTVVGAPDNSEITFSPQTISSGSGETTVTLTIHTPDYPVGPWNQSSKLGITALGLIVGGGLLIPLGRRRRILGMRLGWFSRLLLLFACVTALTTLNGCGSGWRTQLYAITVTASSGQLSHTASATLTSQ